MTTLHENVRVERPLSRGCIWRRIGKKQTISFTIEQLSEDLHISKSLASFVRANNYFLFFMFKCCSFMKELLTSMVRFMERKVLLLLLFWSRFYWIRIIRKISAFCEQRQFSDTAPGMIQSNVWPSIISLNFLENPNWGIVHWLHLLERNSNTSPTFIDFSWKCASYFVLVGSMYDFLSFSKTVTYILRGPSERCMVVWCIHGRLPKTQSKTAPLVFKIHPQLASCEVFWWCWRSF